MKKAVKTEKPLVKNKEPKTHEKAALNKSQLYQWIATSVLTIIVAAVTVSMTLYQIKLSPNANRYQPDIFPSSI